MEGCLPWVRIPATSAARTDPSLGHWETSFKDLQRGGGIELVLDVFQNRIPLPGEAFWVVILSLREVPRLFNTHCTRWAGRGPIPTTTVHL